MKNLKVGTKLLLGFGIMFVLLLLISTAGIIGTQRINHEADMLVEKNTGQHRACVGNAA